MERLYPRCAGIDVHKDSLAVCVRADGRRSDHAYGTTPRELLRLSDDLAAAGVAVVAMESTGVYWRPVWNVLEGRFRLVLANPRHVKRVPGRKTDVSDAQWLADLMEHGLIEPSFVPPRPQRELRDLTRQRTQLLRDRARVVNRIHKALEPANVKIGSVFSDIGGASGRKVLRAMVEGELSAEQMAELVDGRMEAKKPALREALAACEPSARGAGPQGRQGPHLEHLRFMLRQLLEQVDHLDRQVEAFDRRVEEVMSPLEARLVRRLDDVPGFDQRTGQVVVAEVGADMGRFPSPRHLASWAGMCPGNNESAGKRKGGRVRKANPWLKGALTQAAWGASRTKGSYFHQQHRRLSGRRGARRATVAVGHSLLGVYYHLATHPDAAYTDLGADYFERQKDPDREAQRMVKKLERLGYKVDLHRPAA